MNRVHDPLMSPIAWDLGHIAAFEDLWLCQRVGGYPPLRPDLAATYDASQTPRSVREQAPRLEAAEALEFMQAVRTRSLEVLAGVSLTEPEDPLNYDGFVWDMLVQHEHQHNETILQTLKLAEPGVYAPQPAVPPGTRPQDPAATQYMVRIEPGRVELGAGDTGFAYDNERPRHSLGMQPFYIDNTPVTNEAFAEFVAEGGYQRSDWWSSEGWHWRQQAGVDRPLYWDRAGRERDFAEAAELNPDRPVAHVSWYEADAYARWQGKRLPTEAEWETAASWDPEAQATRVYPWGDVAETSGRANLDQLAFAPTPVASYPDGASPYSVLGMVGDLWEWTASEFAGYPGFAAWPYSEYSEIFFNAGYRVLRGGSWATRPRAVRCSFRNWDLPQRRQIFAGFRCATDG